MLPPPEDNPLTAMYFSNYRNLNENLQCQIKDTLILLLAQNIINHDFAWFLFDDINLTKLSDVSSPSTVPSNVLYLLGKIRWKFGLGLVDFEQNQKISRT